MENISMDQIMHLINSYGMPFLWAIIVLIVGRWIAKVLTKTLGNVLNKTSIDVTIVSFVKNIAYSGLMVFVILSAFEQLGVNTTSFTAVLAAAGLAIGLAFQSSLSNFASGFMLLYFRPFKVNDFVEAGGVSGVILEIQLFTTKLKTGDNKIVYVPNSHITGGSITNYSHEATRRVDLVIGVSYDDDIKKVKSTLENIIAEDDRILKDPAVTIGLLELGDNSVNFAVRPWVKTEDYWAVYFDLLEKVKTTFDQEKISFPYPQLDVHVNQ